MEIIICRDVSKAYQTGFTGTRTQKALADFNLKVAKGEVFGIVGPNGAGKSTILKILMGFVRPDAGAATIAGNRAGDLNIRRQIGYLPENPSLYRHLSVTDHLIFAARTAGMSGRETRKRIDEILQNVNLAHAAKPPIKTFSKGMTQRAALAYALFLKPEILILDEPMSGLDPLGRNLVVEIIRQYKEASTTILFSSHILADVEHICTRIGVMNKGEMAAVTTPEELLHMDLGKHTGASRLESFFLNTLSSSSN
ncbi:MAG: ABC transporter ATP-binding protein [Desulfobulbaceae bacterium]|nr:ABC transporter ATP-binding protein [Desulfobulbaceae bacterium]